MKYITVLSYRTHPLRRPQHISATVRLKACLSSVPLKQCYAWPVATATKRPPSHQIRRCALSTRLLSQLESIIIPEWPHRCRCRRPRPQRRSATPCTSKGRSATPCMKSRHVRALTAPLPRLPSLASPKAAAQAAIMVSTVLSLVGESAMQSPLEADIEELEE